MRAMSCVFRIADQGNVLNVQHSMSCIVQFHKGNVLHVHSRYEGNLYVGFMDLIGYWC